VYVSVFLYLLVFVCLYVYSDVLHSLHVVCRLVYLTHFHFCTYIHAVVIICVCQIFIKETACLLACTEHGKREYKTQKNKQNMNKPSIQ